MRTQCEKAKSISIFLLGLFFFGAGISLGNKSLFGGNPMSVFVVGLSRHLPLSIGTCNLIVGTVEMLIGYILDRKNVTIATLIGAIGGSYAIDLANLFIADTSEVTVRIVYMLAGIACYCLGLALQQASKAGYGNLDCFIFGLGKLFKIETYFKIRWIVDIVFIVFGWMLGAAVSIGTAIILACAGLLITGFRKMLLRIIR